MQQYEIVGLTYGSACKWLTDQGGFMVNGHAWIDGALMLRPEGCKCDHCQARDCEVGVKATSRDAAIQLKTPPPSPRVPYPDFCMHPAKCNGRSSCPRRPSCVE